MTSRLVDAGMAYPNPAARWASAPLIVPKPRTSKFRFTVDLRLVNRFTIPHHYPMPLLENEMTKLAGSTCFANFDLSMGYWQLALEKDPQDFQSFLTPDGVFTPTRVIHGTTNAVSHLQSSLSTEVPADLRSSWMHWLEDILLHDKTDDKLVDDVICLLRLCTRLNLRLHPAKCTLYAKELRWCRRLLSATGWRYDPRNVEGLRMMKPPTNGAELQKFPCALQLMRTAIPQFATLVQRLQDFMEKVCNRSGRCTQRSVVHIDLTSLGWNDTQITSFRACQHALAHQVTLSHRDPTLRLSIYTDACEDMWSGLATQVPALDVTKPYEEQKHAPLAFLSGRFSATQLRWSILEKEAFAIMATLERLHWMAATSDGFDLHTHHHNLIFNFDQLPLLPDLFASAIRKVLRWAVRLSIYNYVCMHIRGDDNVWADILGRWIAPPLVRRLFHVPPLPSAWAEDFVWPFISEIASVQQSQASARPAGLSQSELVWRTTTGSIWIPDNSSDLQLRLIIIAHTGVAGPRGIDPTEQVLRNRYWWSTLSADVQSFIRACIHFVSTTGGDRIPRPFGLAVHGSKPNELLQFDYVDFCPGHDGDRYVLILRDGFSNYCWLFSFTGTKAENAANALVEWCAAFGPPSGFLSDGPTHFRNETLRLLSKYLRVRHHFTLLYFPWSNGAVTRLGREIIRTARAMLSELQQSHHNWPDILPIIQSALNNTRSRHRGNYAPLTAFTGLDPTSPIQTFIRSDTGKSASVTDIIFKRCINIEELQDHVSALHPVLANTLEENRKRSRAAVERGQLVNFSEGDFVLVARNTFYSGEKFCLRWRGPRRVIKAVNDYVYIVEDLRNGTLQQTHFTRLKYYTDSSLDATAILSHVVSSETGMQVQRLMRVVDTAEGIYVLIRWRGLPHDEDTQESLQNVYADVPQLLLKLLARENTSPALAAEARSELGLPSEGV